MNVSRTGRQLLNEQTVMQLRTLKIQDERWLWCVPEDSKITIKSFPGIAAWRFYQRMSQVMFVGNI